MIRSIHSHGREPWIFGAKSPGELLVGAHPALMAQVLGPGGTGSLDYLLYSPIWDVAETPFGLVPEGGSHALAVTPSALVITWDRHDGSAPGLQCIPIDGLSSITLGQATLSGWLTLRPGSGSGASQRTIAFHATTGGHHFHARVRALRNRMKRRESGRTSADLSASARDNRSDASLLAASDALLLPVENVELRVATQETWEDQAPRRPRAENGWPSTISSFASRKSSGAVHPLRGPASARPEGSGQQVPVVNRRENIGGEVFTYSEPSCQPISSGRLRIAYSVASGREDRL